MAIIANVNVMTKPHGTNTHTHTHLQKGVNSLWVGNIQLTTLSLHSLQGWAYNSGEEPRRRKFPQHLLIKGCNSKAS